MSGLNVYMIVDKWMQWIVEEIIIEIVNVGFDI